VRRKINELESAAVVDEENYRTMLAALYEDEADLEAALDSGEAA
jgi:hypothetical protein